MDPLEAYNAQVSWLLALLPLVAEESCFALKGGTAINLFVRDLPRLSVDIDLVYLPDTGREDALADISAALKRIAARISEVFPEVSLTESFREKRDALRLIVDRASTQVKIELSPVLRGTVYPPETRSVTARVERDFGYAEIPVVALADLYGGKICAALDRQHPRDLFDVKWLLDNEGITDSIRRAFLVYLISHPRPMAELLAPNRRPLESLFNNEFEAMAFEPVTVAELEQAREALISQINQSLTPEERRFLLGFKRGQPEWPLLGLDHIENLPAVRWKQRNLDNMSRARRMEAIDKLAAVLGVQ